MPTVHGRSKCCVMPWQAETIRPEEAVLQSLRECGHPPLLNVVCRFLEGTVVLTGKVPSYYMKQVAQTVVGQIDGVEQVDNLLEVSSLNKRQMAIAN